MGKGLFWLVFILILVFLLLNFGPVTQALVRTGGEQSIGLISTLQGQGASQPRPYNRGFTLQG